MAKKIKNVAIVGTSSSGKTSLVESILYSAGLISRLGRIDDGNTICDYNEDEIKRKMSINMAVVNFSYDDLVINLIDTPGYPDFAGEVLSALKAVDSAVLVIPADVGVDAITMDIYGYLSKEDIPFCIFVNKFDKENINTEDIINEVKSVFERKVLVLNFINEPGPKVNSYIDILNLKLVKVEDGVTKVFDVPEEMKSKLNIHREEFTDTLVGFDDELTEKYLSGEEITTDGLKNVLNSAYAEKKILPLIFGCAVRNIATKFLLDFIANFSPTSDARNKGGENEDFSAIVFKTTTEPGMGQMNYIRILSGKISSGDDVFNLTRNVKERVGQIAYLFGKKRVETQIAKAGEICALIKLRESRTGDFLGNRNLAPIEFPELCVQMALVGKSKGEEEKIANALSAMMIEDPTFKFKYNPETKEIVASAVGPLQFEVIADRVKSRYGVEIELRKPRIPYKETVSAVATAEGKYKRQSGGRGQYGHCFLRIEPLERGKGFEFVDEIYGGVIPKNYIPSVEKGVIEAMAEGVIAGYPVIDVKVTLYDGSYHEVDSSDIAFRIAARMALQRVVSEAAPKILEPIMEFEISLPDEYLGGVIGDVNARRGRVLGIDKVGKNSLIHALMPLAECINYAIDLRSATKGYGKLKMKFSHYEEVPPHIAQMLIQEYQKSKSQRE